MRIDSRINTTEIARQNQNFVDIDLDFFAHPVTGDITKKVGKDSIKRALRNILFLRLGELGFQPNKGSGVHFLLFELMTPGNLELLRKEIINTLATFEPRITVVQLVISDENELDKNGVTIDLVFSINNYNEPLSLSLFLERIR